jgi:hypothetical protein
VPKRKQHLRGIAAIMLPGLRTLIATVLLAVAILTFAFGAAALLRVAHEDFAALQTWRPAMDPFTETVAANDHNMPTLAALRVEPSLEATEQIVTPATPIALPSTPDVAIAPPAPQPAAAIVAALPAVPKVQLSDAPYNAPRSGPLLMPDIATNDAAPVAIASLAPVTTDDEPIGLAPLPRPKPQMVKPALRKRIVKRTPARRVASRPAAAQARQTPGPFDQLFNSRN